MLLKSIFLIAWFFQECHVNLNGHCTKLTNGGVHWGSLAHKEYRDVFKSVKSTQLIVKSIKLTFSVRQFEKQASHVLNEQTSVVVTLLLPRHTFLSWLDKQSA